MLRAEGSTQAERRTDTVSSRPLLRFGSALQVPPHFHSRVPDGVFVPGEGGVRFEALPPPTQATEVGVRLPARKQPRCAFLEGFCLHANTHLHENAKQGVERLCRYGARGALALERLSRAQDGRLAYRMERRWRTAPRISSSPGGRASWYRMTTCGPPVQTRPYVRVGGSKIPRLLVSSLSMRPS